MLNRIIATILPVFPKKLIWLFSKRYIAGESLDDALRVSRDFNLQGIEVTLDVLGEFQTNKEKIEYYKTTYLETINESIKAGIRTTFSLKPTMFGLLIDKDLCFSHIHDIVSIVSKNGSMIRIDMEDSTCTSLELDLFKSLHKEFPENVGIVLQAYLKRTLDDLKDMKRISNDSIPVNVRLCKGIYIEPESIAYKKRSEINEHFIEDLEYMLANRFYAAIATHDHLLIDASYHLIDKYRVSNDMVEFQMLYGVTPELRYSVVKKDYRMRIYVPFGKDWFNYSTRRLKENPKMVSDIIKALFVRK
ncbi:MAG: proline dehydrogenase family protein [Bacteroidales bacterium]|nr:proline dehydrogenase family protein [Bacteroidales bacterium]